LEHLNRQTGLNTSSYVDVMNVFCHRFEEEILENGVVVPAKMIIGTQTFSQVEARLTNRSTASPPPTKQDIKPQETAPKPLFTGFYTL